MQREFHSIVTHILYNIVSHDSTSWYCIEAQIRAVTLVESTNTKPKRVSFGNISTLHRDGFP